MNETSIQKLASVIARCKEEDVEADHMRSVLAEAISDRGPDSELARMLENRISELRKLIDEELPSYEEEEAGHQQIVRRNTFFFVGPLVPPFHITNPSSNPVPRKCLSIPCPSILAPT